jgi:hypothetical protein
MPWKASGPFAQVSRSVRPPRPVTVIDDSSCTVSKPVAQTSTSMARSWPSAVAMPPSVMRAMPSVTSSTLGWLIAG